MSPNGPTLLVLLAAIASAPMAVSAAEEPVDETLVVARTVMPRIAYHALEPTANPVRAQATVFPGRIFHGMVDGLVGSLAGDDELAERASLQPTGPALRLEPGMAGPVGHAPGAYGPGASQGGRAIGGSIGGAVLRATSGLGDRVSQTVLRATSQSGGP